MNQEKYIKYAYMFMLVLGLYLFLYRNLVDKIRYIWNYGEIYKDYSLINPFSIWNDYGLGSTNIYNVYLALLLKTVDVMTPYGHKILYMLLPIIAFASFFYAAKVLFSASFPVSFVGSLLYALNPVLILLFIGGEYGPLLAYSLQPVIFTSLFRTLEDFKFIRICLLVLVSTLAFANAYHAIWMLLFMYIILLMYFYLHNKDSIFSYIRRLVVITLITMLVHIPSIIQYLIVVNKFSHVGFNEIVITGYCYQEASWENVFRLAGNKCSAQAVKFLNFDSFNNFTQFGHIIILLTILPLLIGFPKYERSEKILYMLFTLFSLLIGIVIIIIKYNTWLLTLMPLLSTLRNPVKLQVPQAFFFAAAFTYSISLLYRYYSAKNRGKRKYLSIIILLIVVMLIFLYNMPALDGTLGLANARKQFYVEYNLSNLDSILKKENGKVLILPWTLQVQKLWYNSRIFNPPSGISIYEKSHFDLVRNLYDIIIYGELNDAIKLASLLNIKYIVIFKKFSYNENLIYKSGNTFRIKVNTFYIIKKLKIVNGTILKEILDNKWLTVFIYQGEASPFSLVSNISKNIKYYEKLKNLIKNPSFEKRLRYWSGFNNRSVTQEPKGNNTVAIINSDGRAFSTITQTINKVFEGRLYEFSFSFKPINNIEGFHAKILWFNQSENFDERLSIHKDFFIPKVIKNAAWQTFRTIVYAPLQAKAARVVILIKKGTILLDNITFAPLIPKPLIGNFHVIQNYRKLDTTLYEVHINITRPTVLLFATTYDPFWRAEVYKNSTLMKIVRPINVYGVNGFPINITGNLTIIIKYLPQKLFLLGLIISFTVLLSCIFYVIFCIYTNKRTRPYNISV